MDEPTGFGEPGRVGATTGGVVAFIMASATLYPLVFAAILAGTGSYGTGFLVAGVPALIVASRLIRRAAKEPAGPD